MWDLRLNTLEVELVLDTCGFRFFSRGETGNIGDTVKVYIKAVDLLRALVCHVNCGDRICEVDILFCENV